MWLRWFGCLFTVITVLEVFSCLSTRPELSLLRVFDPFRRPAILRPGQYRETPGHQSVLETPDEGTTEPDDMGMVHDRRFVRRIIEYLKQVLMRVLPETISSSPVAP